MFRVFVVFFPCASLAGEAVEQRAARSPRSNMALLRVASLRFPRPLTLSAWRERGQSLASFCVDSTGQLSGEQPRL